MIAAADSAAPRLRLNVDALRDRLLFVSVLSSFLVLIEPSPHEALVGAGLLVLLVTNCRIPGFALLVFGLMLALDLSGLVAAIPVFDRPKVMGFVGTSFFLAIATFYYALLLSDNTEARLRLFRKAWIVAALLSAFAGILGYFDVAGTGALFAAYDGTRAKGTFNDPNVFGPFLVAPTLFLAQDILLARGRLALRGAAFLLLCLGQFLSFSRASWGHLAGSLLLLATFTLLTVPSRRLRLRLLAVGAAGLIVLALGFAVLLSFDGVSKVFAERASLQQSYDVKSGGRFDNYLNALDVILDNPLGIGPFAFAARFGEDAHDAYLNTFLSYGWVGGFSYLALVVATLVIGCQQIGRANRFRPHLIALLSAFLPLTLVSLIIHSDHWRHYFLLVSAIWATSAASRQSPDQLATPARKMPRLD